jgi:serine protease Do
MAELADGREFAAKIIGTDQAADIAVLKIDADDLPALELGDVEALSVGDWVVGITNSMGMGLTFSAGMVAAKGRSSLGMAAIEDFVQTDVILHPGDGGGPLLDLDGQVVGINTAIIGRGQGLAISLAIPVNMAKSAYEQIVETGTVERGFLGVAFTDIDTKLVKALGLKTASGVMVSKVVLDSAASKAGIEEYDVIAKVNGIPIGSGQQLLHLVASLRPGAEVDIIVIRAGKRQTLAVTLGKRPSPEEIRPDED